MIRIADSGVGLSPKEFGAGLVNFTIANLTTESGMLAIHGPVDAESNQIPPGGAETLKVDVKPGNYEASVSGVAGSPNAATPA